MRWQDTPVRQIVQKTNRHFSKWTTLPQCWQVICCGCGLTHEYRLKWGKKRGKDVLMKRSRIHQAITRNERKCIIKKYGGLSHVPKGIISGWFRT